MRTLLASLLAGLSMAGSLGPAHAAAVTIFNSYDNGAVTVTLTFDLDESVRTNFGTDFRYFNAAFPSSSPWLTNLNVVTTGIAPVTATLRILALRASDGIFDGLGGDDFEAQFLRSDNLLQSSSNQFFQVFDRTATVVNIVTPADANALRFDLRLPPTGPSESVPEPASLALVAAALAAAASARRRRA